MAPLRCTQNTLSHVDYGIPLLLAKSTDYRTTTGKNHEFVPSIGQHFDCRVKARIKPEIREKDIALRNEFNSTYNKEYEEKRDRNSALRNNLPLHCTTIHHIRETQEKLYMNPPPKKPPKISQMKESYGFHSIKPRRDTALNYTCEMPDVYRGLQPSIGTEERGFNKSLDIYFTENRAQFVPYSAGQLEKAQEDFITHYNACGKHKGLKDQIPGKLHGYKNMYDKRVFRVEFPNRLYSHALKRVPHSGMTSEYRTNYPHPAYSSFFPYIQGSGIYFPESLCGSGPWQNLCPPAMYCSENCHIGSGWPVRATVDVNAATKKTVPHSKTCCI